MGPRREAEPESCFRSNRPWPLKAVLCAVWEPPRAHVLTGQFAWSGFSLSFSEAEQQRVSGLWGLARLGANPSPTAHQ